MQRHTAPPTILTLLWCVAACGGIARPPEPPSATRATAHSAPSEAALSVVGALDRTEEDRKTDRERHPAEMLTFFQLTPGQRVLDLAAAGGYTTELLARAVGPTGRVYAQNSRWLIDNFAERPLGRRLATTTTRNIVRVDREFEDPFPPDAQSLDAVVCVMFYHDLFWLGVDRDKMNRAVYGALKAGGRYYIVDHSGRSGTGSTEVKTLHRIDERLVRSEIERVGFRLRAEGSFLRNPRDTRDWNAAPDAEIAPTRGTSDRFVLAYEKP